MQREVLKCAISNVQCVVAVATQLACSIWIMHYIIYIIITYNNIKSVNNNDICFQNVDPVTILHSPSFLLYCPARFGLFLNPAPFEVNGACPGADAPLFGAMAAVIDTGGCFSLGQSTFGEAIAIPQKFVLGLDIYVCTYVRAYVQTYFLGYLLTCSYIHTCIERSRHRESRYRLKMHHFRSPQSIMH